MRVVYLTAGAAGMYCGSCMRDNTLVAALRAQGRDVVLVPVYTPIRTDEPDVSEPRVLYGGVNVYLQQHSALFRHTPWILDRLFDSPGLLRRVSRWAHTTPPEEAARLTVSILKGGDGAQRKELRKLVRQVGSLGPGVVNLPNVMFAGLAAEIRRGLSVPVVCTLTGEDIFLDKLPEPHRAEAFELIRHKAHDVDVFVAVSRYYADYATRHFGIPPERVQVIPLGVRVEDSSPPPASRDGLFTIGYLARICPEKGLHVLAQAFALLRQSGRACRLRVAGYLGPADQPYFEGVRRHLAGLKLDLEHAGEVDRAGKIAFLQSLHALSVPAVYREPKGLYVLEALANGVPVVQPGHGAFPEILEATAGGLLCEPDDPVSLADQIARLMDDDALRHRLGCQGRSAVLESFTAQVMAERTWSLYERVATDLQVR
jgi:glycosyltransferase involved in cell wall biosynthesis